MNLQNKNHVNKVIKLFGVNGKLLDKFAQILNGKITFIQIYNSTLELQ